VKALSQHVRGDVEEKFENCKGGCLSVIASPELWVCYQRILLPFSYELVTQLYQHYS